MNEYTYKHQFLKYKTFFSQNSVSTLNLKNLSVSEIGYNHVDLSFLNYQWAKQSDAFYFNIFDFLEATHLRDIKKLDAFKQQLFNKRKIITGLLPLFTNKNQETLDFYWLDFFTKLKDIWKNKSLPSRKVIVPLYLVFDKIPHASVACFNFKPRQDTADVIVLEQHAQKKGTSDYDENLDYTDGITLHANAWQEIIHQKEHGFLDIGTVNMFVNDKPICRRHNVCGVVASELARRLLEADDPMKLAKSGIIITNEEVDQLHARNQKLGAISLHSSLMMFQKMGGRM